VDPPNPCLRPIDDVITLVRDVLGGNVMGAYLYGSAVMGGLKPTSDVDIFAVTSRPTTPRDRRALVDGLLPISGSRATRGPTRSIELTTVVQADVRPWRYPPRMDFLYGDWLRAEFEAGNDAPGRRSNPDLATLITMVLQAETPLFGPPAAEVFDAVPTGDLVRAIGDTIPNLLGDLESDTRNVILTLARMWMTAATGEIRSKDSAAEWALERLPAEHRPVLAKARAMYLGETDERWGAMRMRVSPLAEILVVEIRRATP
jgi:predicted nucleotidyltransferase